ncbi:MAG: zinc ribbon domain-containing protein [Anaerolineales bacterium]|jgi:hypothetical protein
MENRAYHGDVTPNLMANALISHFDQGNLRAQALGQGDKVVVQIATRHQPHSGGQTALSVLLEKTEDGVLVQVGNQEWVGLAASFGLTALTALSNPFALAGRLSDIAQDISSLQLHDQVWAVIEATAGATGAGMALSEKLRRVKCEYCGIAAPVGEPACPACGAPLGSAQPTICPHCGFALPPSAHRCPNCQQPISA